MLDALVEPSFVSFFLLMQLCGAKVWESQQMFGAVLSHSIAGALAVPPVGKGRSLLSFPFFTPFINYNNQNICCHRFNRSVAELRSPDLVALEYADLNLKEIDTQVGHLRIRQHVNPLSSSFKASPQVPNWKQVFRDPTLPLMVDIGCGSGRFLIWLAKRSPETKNFLGMEIRHKLVKRAQSWVKELALSNMYFMFANATISFGQIVSTYPGPLMFVSVLFPDPHFKRRHHKRRVLQKPLVDSILHSLTPGGQVLLQSDVLEVVLDMRSQFDEKFDVLEHIDSVDPSIACDEQGWLLNNPMGIRTEREIHAEFEGAKIYRRMYQKIHSQD